jgi:F0F1-type ATP synthase assembly protein I
MGQKNRGGWFIARIGFELVAVTFSCAAVGYYLDSILKMKIFPALSLTGLVIGGAAGFWLVFKEMTRLIDEDAGTEKGDKKDQS